MLVVALHLTRRRERSSPLGWLSTTLAAVIILVGVERLLGPGWPVGDGQVLLVLAVLAGAWSFLDPRVTRI